MTLRRVFAGNGQAAETGAEIKANQGLVLNSPICNVNEHKGQGEPKWLKQPEYDFSHPLKSKTRGRSALHGGTEGRELAKAAWGGVGWDGGEERSMGEAPLRPKHPRSWDVVGGTGTLVRPIMSCPHYEIRCRSEQHPLNNAHITMTTTEFDTRGQLYCACEIPSF